MKRKITIKPYINRIIFGEPYNNGLWNGIILGFGIVLLFNADYFGALFLLFIGVMYYIIYNNYIQGDSNG